MGENPFYYCDVLETITIHPENTHFKFENKVLFDVDNKILVSCSMTKTDETYTIPDGIVEIDYYAFYKNPYIKKVIIPGSVTLIQGNSFGAMSNIQTINYLGRTAPSCDETLLKNSNTGCVINIPTNYASSQFCSITVTDNKNLPAA